MLLLSVLGVTGTWAQTNDPTDYSNNLNFMSGYDGYVGTGNQTYKVLNRQYQNGIRSFNYVDGYDCYPTVQFKVPFGTKYLHFHIFGNAAGGTYEVLKEGVVIATATLPYNSSIISGTNPLTFTSQPGRDYYKIITFSEPLTENTIITIRATSETYNFTVFAVRYEDPTGKGQSLGKPFSVSETISLMRDNVKLTETAYVQGYVASQQTSDNPATFYISDDATHVDELLMNKAKDVNDIQITDEYEVLPRDKVTLACDVPASGLIVTNPKIMLQTKPTYKLYYFDGQNGSWKDMTRGTGNKVNEHTYSVQGMVPDTHYFHVEEYYSGEFFKAYYGQGATGELTPITWETMEKYNLKESNGSNLTVDTEGDYDIVVKQVEYGPKLTVRGFASPRFYLHSNRSYEPIAELVYNGALFVANDVNMQNGEEFWITKGEQGTVYASATGDHETIDADNCISIRAVAGGTNYKMSATGQFNFQFYMANDGQGASITVDPASGEWPAPAPVYKLSYNDGSQYEKAFFDNGDGTYTLTDLYLEGTIRFNPIREFNGEREYYGKEGGNLALHRFNSGNLTLSPDGYDYSLFADGPLTFTIVDPNDGATAPTLTVTGWPEPIYKIQIQDEYVTFTKDADGDSYSAELTVTSSMTDDNRLFAFDIIDASTSEWAYYGIPSTYYLTRHNSQNVPLGSGEEGHHNISLPMGTYTMTINADGTLSVEWPDLIYSLTQLDNSEFTKNDDGSYTKTLEVTTEMFVNNKFDFSIICKNLEDHWVYYGIPSTYGYLNRENSQNIPLGTGEGFLNISLGHAGTYTLTINPDMTLSIEWPTPNYQLCHSKSSDAEIYQIPFVYDERAKSWTLAEPVLFESGEQLWVTDTQTGQGWGLNEEKPTISMSNSSNLTLSSSGNIPSIAGLCPFPLNFMFTEDPNSSALNMNVTGWPEPGYYLYYFTGWNEAGLANKFQDNSDGTFTLTRKEIKNEYTDDSYRFVIMHINYDGMQTIYSHSDEETTLIPQTDGNRSYPLTPSEGVSKMFELSPGIYTFKINNGVDRPYLTVKAEEKMYSVIANGNVENSDMSCFFKKEGGGDIVQATYTVGAGKNGTRGIVVQSRDRSSSEFNWDTEFFIRANQTLPAGTRYHLAFDYKADREAPSESRCYDENFREIYEHGIGTMGFTTKWQHFESEGEITADHSPNDAMRTVGFFLAVLSDAATYHFDNIVFEIDKPKGLLGDVNGDGVINVTDVTELVAYILGNPSSSFILDNADVSGEGNVDVTDVTALVNIILKGNASE